MKKLTFLLEVKLMVKCTHVVMIATQLCSWRCKNIKIKRKRFQWNNKILFQIAEEGGAGGKLMRDEGL